MGVKGGLAAGGSLVHDGAQVLTLGHTAKGKLRYLSSNKNISLLLLFICRSLILLQTQDKISFNQLKLLVLL